MFPSGIILIVLVALLVTCHAQEYRWNAVLLKHVDTGTSSTETQDFESLDPVIFKDEVKEFLPFVAMSAAKVQQTSFSSSQYVLEVAVLNKNNQASETVMRHMVLAGSQPVVKIYDLPTKNEIDGGQVILQLHGILSSSGDGNVEEISNVKWSFPLPVNEHTNGMTLEISSRDTGSAAVKTFKKTLFMVKHAHLQTTSLPIPFSVPNSVTPVIYQTPLTVVTANDYLVFSSTEFEHSVVKKVPGDNSVQQTDCSEAVETVYEFFDQILHFTKKGIFWSLKRNQQDDFRKMVEGSEIICARLVSLSPSSRTVIISTSKQLYFLSVPTASAENDGTSTLAHLLDTEGQTFLSYANFNPSYIAIVALAYGSDALYVVLHHSLTNKFVMLKYTGMDQTGQWKFLVEFKDKLPTNFSLNNNIALFTPHLNYRGASITIKGLSCCHVQDGNLYLWGNVLLVFDIRSGVIGAVPLHDSSLLLNDIVMQFVSQKHSYHFSLITRNGKIWHGKALGFETFRRLVRNNNSVQDFAALQLGNVLGLFFDSFDELYLLAIVDSGVERFAIKMNYTTSGQNEPILMKAECSNISLLSRHQNYAFHFPRVWPAFSKSANLDHPKFTLADTCIPLHSQNMLMAYRAIVQMLVTQKKIGKHFWWKQDKTVAGSDWYIDNIGYEDYLHYLATNNLPVGFTWKSFFSMHDYLMEHSFNPNDCIIPKKLYLDKDMKLIINFSLSAASDNILSSLEQQDLFVSLSQNGIVEVVVERHSGPFETIFEVTFKGCQLPQHSSGANLQPVGVKVQPWHYAPTVQGIDFVVMGGCPPALSLGFDRNRSIQILADRGRTDDFECLYEVSDEVPCFTTSEFVTAFFVYDHITGLKTPFKGNFTLKIVGGGVGYHENIKSYSEEEIKMYNYMPGDSKKLESLMWTVLDLTTADGMKDNATGQYIFNGNNPASIVFECRIDSPCGSIPFGVSNPSDFRKTICNTFNYTLLEASFNTATLSLNYCFEEFYLVMEVSNKGVDSSTNCDFTTTFEIHIIGIELNAKSHFTIMLVTLGILLVCIVIYYQSTDGQGIVYARKFLGRWKIADQAQKVQPQIKILHAGGDSKVSIGSYHSHVLARRGSQRQSLLSPALSINRSSRRRSIAAVENIRRMSTNVPMMSQNRFPDPQSDVSSDRASTGSKN